jgi:hypothetical protein
MPGVVPTPNSSIFNLLAVSIWLGAAIGGIVLGNTFKIIEYNVFNESLISGEHFNWGLAIGTWIGGFLQGMVFYGFSAVLKMVEPKSFDWRTLPPDMTRKLLDD